MVRYQDTLWCDGCGIEISGEPASKDSLEYCCSLCLRGEKCNCEEPEEEISTTGRGPEQTQIIGN